LRRILSCSKRYNLLKWGILRGQQIKYQFNASYVDGSKGERDLLITLNDPTLNTGIASVQIMDLNAY
jgi:hypothetical protein